VPEDSLSVPKDLKKIDLSGQYRILPDRNNRSVFWKIQPEKVSMQPFRASLIEPRFGLSKSLTTSTMKVDIGNAVDLINRSYWMDRDFVNSSAGIDFFTYVRVTGWEGLRLQVDAVDGLFGGHLTHIISNESTALQFRFRFLHLSAHYVDGHYDEISQQWKDGRTPVPFTRDFADFTFSYRYKNMRAYALFEHAFRIRPFAQKRTWYQAGCEWYLNHGFGHGLHPYVAQDLRLVGFNAYLLNSTSMIGVKWGTLNGSGIDVFLRYYTGSGPSSEYSDIRANELSLGFSIDYW
jgi:hypothetical protein